MNKKDIEKIVSKSIFEYEERKIKNIETYKWDSLMQLNILLNLQKKYKNQTSKLNELGSINNLKNLLKLFKKNKLLK